MVSRLVGLMGLSHRMLFGFLILPLFLQAQSVSADRINGLYEATISVTSQNRDSRNEATRLAFAEVLSRVSGRTDLFDSGEFPTIDEAMLRATKYVQQYRFKRIKVAREDGRGTHNQLVLWVRFDESAVNSILSQNLLPVWGKARPATLVWLVIDNKGERELVGNNSSSSSRAQLIKQAKQRGVPLRFPLLDLQDTSALRVSDVWGNFEDTILKASERYRTEAVLVGRVSQSGSNYWTARWSLYQDSRRYDWTTSGTIIAEVLNPGIDKTVEVLAQRFAQFDQKDESERVLIHIKEVKTLADYNRTVKYLSSVSNVTSVQTHLVSYDNVYFYLNTGTGRTGVSQSISLGHTLIAEQVESYPGGIKPEGEPGNSGVNPDIQKLIPDLVYRLVP